VQRDWGGLRPPHSIFDGLMFWAEIETKHQDGYKPRNAINYIITPDLPDYPRLPQAIVPRGRDMDDEIPF
jgi:hypothetical protein